MTAVAIALGSNLGDRRANLDYGVDALRAHLSRVTISAYLETEPSGVAEPQPTYLNAALTGDTDLSARALLDLLLSIERERGRARPRAMAPRTLDLDLILYGSAVIMEPGLTVPHPRFRERRFVLEPLATIAPELIDPVTGQTIAELLLKA